MNNGNESAYPNKFGALTEQGLTKREVFAATALQGLLANPKLAETRNDVIAMAVRAADELIIELEKDFVAEAKIATDSK